MIQIIPDTFDQRIYDDAAAHPMQLWAWGEARKNMGLTVHRFGEYKGKRLVNVYQMTLHAIPYTGTFIGYVPRSNTPSKELISFLKEFGKKERIALVKFEPNVIESKEGRDKMKELVKSPYTLFPKWTITLDLKPSEEQLLKNMKPKTRYNIKLAQKKGVTVKEVSTTAGFEIFIRLYFETTARQKYFGHSKDYHREIFNALKAKSASVLIATYDDTPLAAYELFYHKDTLYYPYGGSSTENQNVMAPNLIMWEAIKFGKAKGLKSFDMWGSLDPNYDPKDIWAGFTRFKEGYGGKFTEMIGTYDLVMNPLVYHAFNLAQRLRSLLLGV